MAIMDENGVDKLIEDLEPRIVRGQLNSALRRVVVEFEQTVERDGVQAGRRLIELIHLVAGDRRIKCLEVSANRRIDYEG